MIIASGTQFHIFLLWGQRPFSIVGAFSVIVQLYRLIDLRHYYYTVLCCTVLYCTVAPAQVASYSFQNAFFYLQWPDSASAVASLGPALPALTKTRRRHKLHPPKQRSKYICLPAEVKEVRRQQLAGLGQWHWPVLLCCLIFISHKLFMFRLETILFGNFTEEKH